MTTPRFDLLLCGGLVADGLGTALFRADVGVIGDKIAAIGDLVRSEALTTIDATGQVIAPGFIDIHTHSDVSVLFTPGMESSLAQGVTSEVVGNCGISLGLATNAPEFGLERRWLEGAGGTLTWETLAGFLARVEESGMAINIATLAGHGSLRKRVMGMAQRAPSDTELTVMQRELDLAMQAGAIGLSSGLEYVPGSYADVAELTALAKVAASYGGFYATHLRDEGDLLEESVAEAIAVAEGAGLPLQLSHHKAERKRNWGKILSTLAMVDAAQARGMDILLDQYPYTAYQTSLAVIALPTWANAGNPEDLAQNLTDPALHTRAREWMGELERSGGVSWDAIEIASCPHPALVGKSITENARAQNLDPRDFILNLLTEGSGWISAAHFAMSETDVERILSDPRVMIGSDSVAMNPAAPDAEAHRPHPRSYGTFARILEHYVREKNLLTLPEAIRRMTSLPAQRLGWTERGSLKVGSIADITVFSPDTIHENATFVTPHALATGVSTVIVSGQRTWQDGKPTGARGGKVLRHQ
ncbi:amidohydrolase family protein [Armatimonas sp.]|uniref:N-acyl-D-amino-acid deacylase family protein n=1 Tax=Armatimonas sp. TaxID=1872638 RepID=UPI0037518574